MVENELMKTNMKYQKKKSLKEELQKNEELV